jgi:hypothetical protein
MTCPRAGPYCRRQRTKTENAEPVADPVKLPSNVNTLPGGVKTADTPMVSQADPPDNVSGRGTPVSARRHRPYDVVHVDPEPRE